MLTVNAMRLFVLYWDMRTLCLSRERECKDCPYFEKHLCDKRSTDDVLEYCYKVFSDFIDDV
jgi:hypothetical protein